MRFALIIIFFTLYANAATDQPQPEKLKLKPQPEKHEIHLGRKFKYLFYHRVSYSSDVVINDRLVQVKTTNLICSVKVNFTENTKTDYHLK